MGDLTPADRVPGKVPANLFGAVIADVHHAGVAVFAMPLNGGEFHVIERVKGEDDGGGNHAGSGGH